MIDESMLSLMTWIARTTGQPPPVPPTVVVHEAAVRPSLSPLAPHRLAVYDQDSRTIHMAHDWDGHGEIDRSVLLHALLHHVQPHPAESDRCHHAREAEAYRLQALWLSEQGIDFRQAFGMSPSLIARLHLCADMQVRGPRSPSSARLGQAHIKVGMARQTAQSVGHEQARRVTAIRPARQAPFR
jgi:hypothetical protein